MWMKVGGVGCLLPALLSAACDQKHGQAQATAPSGSIPDVVQVAAAKATLGHARGTLRQEVTLAGFAITRFPVTQKQYGQCVSAGACSAAGEVDKKISDGLAKHDVERLPQLGVSLEQAGAYCAWVGGELPSYAQWLVAARGPSVRRFAWGDDLPTCGEYHLDSKTSLGIHQCCGDTCRMPRVGTHEKGQSPIGLQDVLTAPGGELVQKGSESGMGAFQCVGATGCVARSFDASMPSIDGLGAATDSKDFAFRCVMAGGS